MNPFSVVIPTNGESPHLLPLVESILPDAEQVTIVWTVRKPLPDLPPEVVVIHDIARRNINRWWNKGIAASPTDIVCVLNDDVEAPPGSLARLVDALGDATLAMLSGYRLTGWCYALNRTHGVLPDERLDWYYSDDLLLDEAPEPPAGLGRGVVLHDAPEIVHHKFRPIQHTHVRRDRDLYRRIRQRG